MVVISPTAAVIESGCGCSPGGGSGGGRGALVGADKTLGFKSVTAAALPSDSGSRTRPTTEGEKSQINL